MKHNKKNGPSYAIYNFPYFKRERGFSRITLLKALLAFITCWSGTAYSNYLLKINGVAILSVFAALLSFTFFYTLLTFFKKRYVGAFVLAMSGLGWLIYKEELIEAAKSFFRYVLKISDGPLVSTGGSYIQQSDPFPILTLIYIVFGLICAAASLRRFYPEPIFIFVAIMSVPAFLSLTASYNISLGVFIAGMIGQWAINTSAAANLFLSTGGVYNMHTSDRIYRKGVSKFPLKKRISMDAQRYGRHLSDGFIMFVVTLTTIGIVASVFPNDGAIRFDKIISSAAEFFQNVEGWSTNIFNNLTPPSFDGFLSADSGSINLSGGLSPDGHSRTGVKIAEVITESKRKLYLRGDIGYSFNGTDWKSISTLNFNDIKYDHYDAETFEYQGSIPIQEAFDKYIPEIQYYLAYTSINAAKDYYDESTTYIGLQTVKVNYLRNMNTVLFPGTPFVYNFRDNKNFSVKGDFVALANKGKINSMETGVLYLGTDPNNCITKKLENPESLYYFDDSYFKSIGGVTKGEYDSYLRDYEEFVKDYYTEISEEDKKNIEPFVKSVLNPYVFDSSYIINDIELESLTANRILFELRGGDYKYSLSTDNFTGEHSPIYSFLYETKSGHCAMYATAMCLALRYLGYPARYVTGFTVGDNYVSNIGGRYTYELTDSDLHAWVEVYYKDVGWLPYDPTPPTDSSSTVDPAVTSNTSTAPITTHPFTEITTNPADTTFDPAETTAATTSSNSDSTSNIGNTTDPENGNGISGNSQAIKIILTVVGILIIIFVIIMSIVGALKGLNRKQRELLKFFKNGDTNKAVKAMLDFMLKLLILQEIRRQKGETPEEFGKRVDKALGCSETVSRAIPIFEKSEYDKDPVFSDEDRQKVYSCVTEILDNVLVNMKSLQRLFTRFKLFGRKTNQ